MKCRRMRTIAAAMPDSPTASKAHETQTIQGPDVCGSYTSRKSRSAVQIRSRLWFGDSIEESMLTSGFNGGS